MKDPQTHGAKDPLTRGPQEFDLIVRSGQAVTPDGVRQVDIGVRAGRFAAVEPNLRSDGAKDVVDARDKLVLPGGIDPHTHMGIPIKDTRSADDFESGSIAAAFGGTTTILDFTVQHPGQTLGAALEARLAAAGGQSRVDFGIHINVTDQPDVRLREIPGLVARGFNSFKAFTTYREQGMMIDWGEFRRLLEVVESHDGLLMLHAEDDATISRLTRLHLDRGERAPIFHARSRPPEAEALAIENATRIAGEVGARLYVVHLSSRAGLESALRARDRGVRVYLETCPQYLVLEEGKYEGPNGHRWITTPPLRRAEDVAALWGALKNGDLDTVGTDHCPFTIAQKDRGAASFDQVPNGLPGVENRLPMLFTYGVAEERISVQRMAQLLAGNVARIFGIDDRKGSIAVGRDADLVIWDPSPEGLVTADQMHGASDFTAYQGMRRRGQLSHTILRGRILVRENEFVKPEMQGELVTANPS